MTKTMKKHLVLLLLPFLFSDCKETPTPKIGGNCTRVTDVTTPSICYDKTKGMLLKATNMPQSSKMVWVIAPLADTITTDYKAVYLLSDSSSVVVPDSIVGANRKIGIVFAGTEDCVADYYFSFVRRLDPANKCERWHLQEKFFIGN